MMRRENPYSALTLPVNLNYIYRPNFYNSRQFYVASQLAMATQVY